ncbi:MAG: hypothetical protein WC260_03825 [Candidatus Pacearchaeota archaeon]
MMPSFGRLMTHKLKVRKRARDWQGSFSDVTHFRTNGFVEYGKRIVAGLQGEDVTASATVFLPSNVQIDVAHEHWLIDQTAPYQRKGMEVIRIDPIDDPRTGKTHHYEISVK